MCSYSYIHNGRKRLTPMMIDRRRPLATYSRWRPLYDDDWILVIRILHAHNTLTAVSIIIPNARVLVALLLLSVSRSCARLDLILPIALVYNRHCSYQDRYSKDFPSMSDICLYGRRLQWYWTTGLCRYENDRIEKLYL